MQRLYLAGQPSLHPFAMLPAILQELPHTFQNFDEQRVEHYRFVRGILSWRAYELHRFTRNSHAPTYCVDALNLRE
jgi:hypothetical protein